MKRGGGEVECAFGLERGRRERVALRELRQRLLLGVVGRVVLPLLVGEQEAAEGDHRAGCRELGAPAVRGSASMRTDTVWPRTSAICEATVRFQIRS